MLANYGQALVQGDKRLRLGTHRPRVPVERPGQQVADEPTPILTTRRFGERSIQRRGVPGGAPLVIAARKLGDEPLVTLPGPQLARVGDQLIVSVDGRQRGAGVKLADMGDVAAQDGGVQRLGVWHVIGHQQELPAAQPRVVLGDHVGEALLAPRLRVTAQDRVQDGHEVRLTRTERSVEVGGPGAGCLHGGLDQAERLVEAGRELFGDYILGDRRLLVDPLGQGEHEVPGMHLIRDRDEVPQQHLGHAPPPR